MTIDRVELDSGQAKPAIPCPNSGESAKMLKEDKRGY